MMILPIGSRKATGASARGAGGFTLIEFILVMSLLIVVFAVSIPTLSNFFRGRTLDAEARRFVSLTRYGQSRAVSESLPMILWIDVNERTYGLEREYTYDNVDPKAVEYTLAPDLGMEVLQARTQTRNISAFGQSQAARRNLPMIRFQPDGFIGPESVRAVWLTQTNEHAATVQEQLPIQIAQSRNGLSYEIQTNQLETVLR